MRGRVGEEEGMRHSTWIITPADTGPEDRCPVGSIWISGERGPCSDRLMKQLLRMKGGGQTKDQEIIIYEHLLCSRHLIKGFIYVLSLRQVLLSSFYK